MSQLFAVFRDYGPGFGADKPLEAQAAWPEHARFMDELAAQGTIALAGPLGDTEDVLLVMRAKDGEEVDRLLANDPWTANAILRTRRIANWTLRIGSLG